MWSRVVLFDTVKQARMGKAWHDEDLSEKSNYSLIIFSFRMWERQWWVAKRSLLRGPAEILQGFAAVLWHGAKLIRNLCFSANQNLSYLKFEEAEGEKAQEERPKKSEYLLHPPLWARQIDCIIPGRRQPL